MTRHFENLLLFIIPKLELANVFFCFFFYFYIHPFSSYAFLHIYLPKRLVKWSLKARFAELDEYHARAVHAKRIIWFYCLLLITILYSMRNLFFFTTDSSCIISQLFKYPSANQAYQKPVITPF